MDGRAFLEVARELARGDTEAHRRTAAGRTYYALMLEARDVLLGVLHRRSQLPPLDVEPRPGLLFLVAADRESDAGAVGAVEHRAVRWLGPDDLDDVDWLPADRILLPALRALLS